MSNMLLYTPKNMHKYCWSYHYCWNARFIFTTSIYIPWFYGALVSWNWEHGARLLSCVHKMRKDKQLLMSCKFMQIELVKLLPICHSEMDKVVSENASVRYSLLLNACCFGCSVFWNIKAIWSDQLYMFFFSFNWNLL